ncbi:MAG: hypothetical protein LBC62_10605 [Treponema sp.]|nr:hypothetical protein [Treponema sp.]
MKRKSLIKKTFLTLVFAVLFFVLNACDIGSDIGYEVYGEDYFRDTGNADDGINDNESYSLIPENVGKTEDFYVLNLEDSGERYTFDTIKAKVLAEDSRCIIYAEVDPQTEEPLDGITRDKAEQLSEEYWKNIHALIVRAYGPIKHVTAKDKPGSGKVTFLLTDIRDSYTGSGGYVAGFFAPFDMEKDNPNGIRSNERDMLYIDTDPGFSDDNIPYATMAHELQHLINYSNTVAVHGYEPDLWINEGLSTAAEYLYGGDPNSRVSYYNQDPYGSIRYGNNFFVWDDDDDVLADYSTGYLFFQWLRLHADNGEGIYKDIYTSLKKAVTDYRAVTRAAKFRMRIPDMYGSDQWEPVLKSWYLANIVGAPGGIYGYNNQISEITGNNVNGLTVHYLRTTSGAPVSLAPGEGVFSKMTSSSYTPLFYGVGPNIRYAGADRTQRSVVLAAPYSGEYFLTLNVNSNYRGGSEYGPLVAASESSEGAGNAETVPQSRSFSVKSSSAQSDPLPGTYPVDAWVMLKRNKKAFNE